MLFLFPARRDAWRFMRRCDAAGASAGFPDWNPAAPGVWTVRTLDDSRTWTAWAAWVATTEEPAAAGEE